ncbi:MAG: nucleoside-diphosphate kinase [Dehalococcoidia bacterium]|nr:Nucleoside diphosphate kinase [Chloroflexota bacterium]MBT9159543.1 Nucleoside diphosphate kinase [Chloroflexota bacterium]MBT9161810.1 Nucleoside diphosphate kinase [Chloroflexota bacterium]
MERTLVLIKPDALQRGLAGEIISRLERRGLKIVAMKMIQMDAALAKRHYAIHEGKAFFEKLVAYITSAPIIAVIFDGPRAVDVARRTIGETDPASAAAGTIRGDLSVEIGRNLVHGSDSLENAQEEIGLFFSPQEVISYEREIDHWIIES